MSPVSATARIAELRHALAFAKTARERLRDGKLDAAVRYYGYAIAALAFVRGALSAGPGGFRAMDCTGGLRRALAELGHAIEAAAKAGVEPMGADDCTVDVIEDLAAAIDVLRTRDGLPMNEEQSWERARCTAFGLMSKFHFSRIV